MTNQKNLVDLVMTHRDNIFNDASVRRFHKGKKDSPSVTKTRVIWASGIIKEILGKSYLSPNICWQIFPRISKPIFRLILFNQIQFSTILMGRIFMLGVFYKFIYSILHNFFIHIHIDGIITFEESLLLMTSWRLRLTKNWDWSTYVILHLQLIICVRIIEYKLHILSRSESND